MKIAFLVACFAVTSFAATSPASACTQEGARSAAKAGAKGLAGKNRIEGKFIVERVKIGNEEYDYPRTIYGTITSKKGKRYQIEQNDDGAIILCTTYNPANRDAEGLFYVAKNKNGTWRIIQTEYNEE